MKFTGHYVITVFIALIVSAVFGYEKGIIIALAHYLPSIDWLLKRVDIFYHHHRSMVHNIFVIPLSYLLFLWLTKNHTIAFFCGLSTALHIAIDYLDIGGKGIALFFPFSQKRYKKPMVSETIEDIIVNGSMLGTIIVCIMLVI